MPSGSAKLSTSSWNRSPVRSTGMPAPSKRFSQNCKRGARNTECSGRGLSNAQAAAGGMRPGEEGQNGPRRAAVVAKVEVIRSGIVKVDGALDETKPQHFGVEVKIALRVGSNRCYVMQANDGFWHDPKCKAGGGQRKGHPLWVPFSLLLVCALRQVVAEGGPEHVVGALGVVPMPDQMLRWK